MAVLSFLVMSRASGLPFSENPWVAIGSNAEHGTDTEMLDKQESSEAREPSRVRTAD